MSFLVSLFLGLNSMTGFHPQKKCISPEEIYRMNQDRVVMVNVDFEDGSGSGTGVFTNNDGEVITSTHVVQGASSIYTDFQNKRIKFSLNHIGDPHSISRIYTDQAGMSFSTSFRETNSYQVGELVYTIGYPGGLKKLFAAGHISSIDEKLITVAMPFYPGMSGSPVYDCEGSVIGYVYAFIRGANTIGIVNKNEN